MFLNVQIDLIVLKTYDQQFTLTTKKSLHIIFKVMSAIIYLKLRVLLMTSFTSQDFMCNHLQLLIMLNVDDMTTGIGGDTKLSIGWYR